MDPVEDFLAHYGIKGMRWGHHKSDTPGSEDHTRATEARSKVQSGGVKALTNKELRDAIERANLEQQYHRLHPTATKKAAKFVADILLGVGKQELIKLVSTGVAKGVRAAATR